jgi:transcription elongation factor Elf1
MDFNNNPNNSFTCPACNGKTLVAKYEAKYVYSYIIDDDAPGLKNTEEFLPFLYDNREQKEARQYIECSVCGAQFPCYFSEGNKGIDFKVFQKAVRLY